MELKITEKPFSKPGDWVAGLGFVVAAVSCLAFPWLGISVDLGGLQIFKGEVRSIRFTELPCYWLVLMAIIWVAAVVLLVIGPKWRGWVAVGAGGLYAAFSVVFFFGAWYKVHAIVGDIASLLKKVPFIGGRLAQLFEELTKSMISLHFKVGYFLFIAAALLLIAGGVWRLVSVRRES